VIVDTNALSAIADEQPGIRAVLQKATLVAIPVIVLGEYIFGVSQSTHRSHYQKWLGENLPGFRIFNITDETAQSLRRVATAIEASRNANTVERSLDRRAMPRAQPSSVEPQPPFRSD
jgi:tRNA(fMet)-specific endonuclease VapC